MKNINIIILFALILFSTEVFSQTPPFVNYQAVVRGTDGMPIKNQDISLEIKIYNSASNTVFSEIHNNLNTGNTGLVNIKIGTGQNAGDGLDDIAWGLGDYFLQIAIDLANGNNFTILGAQELISVPYAFYAENTGNVDDADSDPANELQDWNNLPGIPADFTDNIDNVDDADNDPTNELQDWNNLPGIPSDFADDIDNVDDADNDPTNELQDWNGLPGIPSDFADNVDNVDDADDDPTNEIQTLSINGDTIILSDGNAIVIPNNNHWGINSDNIFNLNSGDVGINTDSPNHQLDVNGDVNIEGFPHKNGVPIIIVVPNGPHTIQQGIDALPTEGGTVFIKSGTYLLNEGIHINRSNVTIEGEQGVKVRLADGVNQPVFLVGTDNEIPGVNDTIFNVTIRDLEIDGNKEGQTSETNPSMTWIRNNGIDVRMVQNIWVQNVNIHNAISGGLVVVHSRKMFVSNSYFHHNEFDGIALYTSSELQISNIICSNNKAAGISLDNNLSFVNFDGGFSKDNGSLGIFVRNSNNLKFSNLTISGNVEDGCFAASDDDLNGVTRLFFQGCSFLNNGRYGFWMASPVSQSPQNTITGCLFSENAEIGSEPTCTGINISPGGMLFLAGNICQ